MVAKSGEMLYITHVGHFPDVIRLERYRRGHNEPHSKCGRQETGARVRIPFSPPTKRTSIFACPFCFSVLNKRDSARCVASCRLWREPLRRKAGAPLLRVNSPASLLHEPFLSAIKKQRNSYLLLHKASYIDSVALIVWLIKPSKSAIKSILPTTKNLQKAERIIVLSALFKKP